MFDFVAKNKKLIQIFMILVALTFVTWGVESYTSMRSGRDVVATVNGMDISSREFGEELRRQQDQMRQLFGRNFDPEALDTPESRRAVLDSVISQRLVASAALKAHLTVNDDTLVETIHSIPAFQEGGKFSKATYEAVLRQQNPPLTPAQFESRMRYDLSLAQLARAVGDAAIPSRAVTQRMAALESQQREIAEITLPAQQFLPQVKLDEAKVKAYYDANPDQFKTPERVKAEYVMLSADALAAQEAVSPDEVKKTWESAYGPKLREKEEARKKAQAIAAQVRKDPASFAEVAKKESQDPGSAANGGDLGFAPRGAFVKPFEDAVFRMKEGQVSDVVESEFGFHIIRLTGIQRKDGKEERRASHILIPAPADAKSFESLREQIEADLKKSRASKLFSDSAEAFQNMVYEQSDSLKPAAERFKLKIQTTGWVAKSHNQELGALDNPKLVAALFSSDSLRNKRNTDAIEVAPGTLVAARVVEHEPATQRKFDEVKGDITEMLKLREAAARALKEGEAKLAQLRKGEGGSLKWGQARAVSRRDPKGLPNEVLRPVLMADVAKLPAYIGIPVPDAGYLLVRISKVTEADPKQGGDAAGRAAGLLGAAQYQAYVASLRNQADVEINQKNLEKK